MNNQQRIDEFVSGMREQVLQFIEDNNLLPHGWHYDVNLRFKRFRDEMEVTTQTYMNGPNWEPAKGMPSEEEWETVLGLECFRGNEYKATVYREFLREVKADNVGGAYTRFSHYTSAINNLLGAFVCDYRLFRSQLTRKHFVLRKIR